MIPQDLAAQFELYAQSNENAYKESMGDAEPGTKLHNLRHIYFHWKLERAHTFRLAAEMVRDHLVNCESTDTSLCLTLRWTKERPTRPGVFWLRGLVNRENEIRLVRYDWPRSNPGNPDDLYAMDVEKGGCVPIRLDQPNLEWCGPLAEPERSITEGIVVRHDLVETPQNRHLLEAAVRGMANPDRVSG